MKFSKEQINEMIPVSKMKAGYAKGSKMIDLATKWNKSLAQIQSKVSQIRSNPNKYDPPVEEEQVSPGIKGNARIFSVGDITVDRDQRQITGRINPKFPVKVAMRGDTFVVKY